MQIKSNQTFLLILGLLILSSCTKGKIEFRKSTTGCINFPELSQRAYTDTSTTMEADKILDLKLESLLKNKSVLQSESKQVYLVNNSNSDSYSYTVKSTTSDSINPTNTTTNIYKLQPGEELLLGCDTYITSSMDLKKITFKIVGAKKTK